MNTPRTAAERIRHLHTLGHTQRAIAKACSLSPPTVHAYVHGRHNNAGEDVAERVRAAYQRLTRKPK